MKESYPSDLQTADLHKLGQTTSRQLAQIVNDVAEKLCRGEAVDFDRLVDQYPEYAAELGDVLTSVQTLMTLDASSPFHEAGSRDGSSAIGQLGDYRILREIGRGGMGVVYEAKQISLSRQVALKVLPFAAVLDPNRLQRFKNEAQAAAALDHPNIVGVHSIGCERGVHYYAMQYIEGQTLAEVIQQLCLNAEERKRPASPLGDQNDSNQRQNGDDQARGNKQDTPKPATAAAETRAIAALSTRRSTTSPAFFRSVAQLGIQVAEALEYAHQMGVVHRDIKPSNLMVDPHGRVWVTDFGLAMTQTDTSLTLTGDILGTLRYMSPEQIEGNRRVVDHLTDIYSLGATLYELTTLRPVFAGDSRQKLLRQISDEEPHPPRDLNTALPRDLETIVLKAMAKEPRGRYGSAQAMAEDLHHFLANEPILARRPTAVERMAKWSRRHRTITWSAAATFAVGILLASVLAWGRFQQRLDVERDVSENLAAATAFVQAGEYAAAHHHVGRARGRLDESGFQLVQLRTQAERLADRISNKAFADKQFRRFQELRSRVHAQVLCGGNLDKVERAQLSCVAALDLYRVSEDRDWNKHPTVQELDAYRQTVLQEDILELQILWTYFQDIRAGQETDDTAAAGHHRRAVEALKRIEAIHGPSPGVSLSMALHYDALGEEVLARKAREKAEATKPRTAMEYFLLARHEEEDNPEQALEHYRLALRQKHDHYLSLLFSGMMLIRLERHEAAVATFTGAIATAQSSLEPKLTAAYHERGLALEKMGEYDKAIGDFSLAQQLDSQSAIPSNHVKSTILSARGMSFFRQGQFEQAFADLDEAVRLSPNGDEAYGHRGYVHKELGHFKEAVDDLSEAIRLGPEHDSFYNNRGMAYAGLRQPDRAIADFNRAIQINRECATAFSNRGMLYMHMGQLEKALADCTKAIELDPDDYGGYNNRACVYIAKEAFDEALVDCTRAIELAPDEGQRNYYNRGWAYMGKREFDAAIADFTEAIRLHPTAFSYHSRANAYVKMGEFDKAIDDYTVAIRLEPTNAEQYSRRGFAFKDKGDYDRAIADLTKAIEFEPNSARHYSNRGATYLVEMDDPERAIADLNKAIELNPEQSVALRHRASAYVGIGKIDEAVSDARQAIQLDPTDHGPYEVRASAYCEKGEFEKAIGDYGRTVELISTDHPCYMPARCQQALALLAAGDGAAYRDACKSLLEQFGNTENVKTAWTCSLIPDAVENPQQIVPLAERAVEADPQAFQVTALGAALYRVGKYEQAVKCLGDLARGWEGGTDTPTQCSPAYTWFFLAMAHHRLGDHAKAERLLETAAQWTDRVLREHEEGTSRRQWNRRQTLRLLRKEAQAVLYPSSEATHPKTVPQGTKTGQEPDEPNRSMD